MEKSVKIPEELFTRYNKNRWGRHVYNGSLAKFLAAGGDLTSSAALDLMDRVVGMGVESDRVWGELTQLAINNGMDSGGSITVKNYTETLCFEVPDVPGQETAQPTQATAVADS